MLLKKRRQKTFQEKLGNFLVELSRQDWRLTELIEKKNNIMSKYLLLISEHAEMEELGLNFSYPDIVILLPLVIICGISILLIVLWLLVVWEYLRLRDKQDSK